MQNSFLPDYPLSEETLGYSRKRQIATTLISVFINLVIAIMVLVLLMYATLEPVRIRGSSMTDTFLDNESVLIDKLFKNPKRGDVVVINNGGTRIIKRVVAVGGDRIGFVLDGDNIALYLDTGSGFTELTENYIREPMDAKTLDRTVDSEKIFKAFSVAASYDEMINGELYMTLKAGEMIVLGDNRNNSRDSRYYGAFKTGDVVGRYLLTISKNSFLAGVFGFFYREAESVPD